MVSPNQRSISLLRDILDVYKAITASTPISRGTTIEISPVLFFSREEYYERHGKHTTLDSYTFRWGDGRMALPLGLGEFTHF
jgi:tRNA-specific adenosine deaminase 3